MGLLNQNDIKFFRAHGYWLSPSIFSDIELDAAIEEQDRFYKGEHERDNPIAHTEYPGWQMDTGNKYELRKNDYAWYQNSFFYKKIISKPEIGQIASKLMGTDSVRLWHDQLLYKPPLNGGIQDSDSLVAVGWHTDFGYWRSCTGPMITAWVPFTDIDLKMGPLVIIDRSNNWPDSKNLSFFDNDLEGVKQNLQQDCSSVSEKPILMKRGQVSFHCWHTIHGSYPNESEQPRRSLAIHMQAGSNCWQHAKDPETGESFTHMNDILVKKDHDGNPDYSDAEICPHLYP